MFLVFGHLGTMHKVMHFNEDREVCLKFIYLCDHIYIDVLGLKHVLKIFQPVCKICKPNGLLIMKFQNKLCLSESATPPTCVD